ALLSIAVSSWIVGHRAEAGENLLEIAVDVDDDLDLSPAGHGGPNRKRAGAVGRQRQDGVVGPGQPGREVEGAGRRRALVSWKHVDVARGRGCEHGHVDGDRPRSGRDAAAPGDRKDEGGARSERTWTVARVEDTAGRHG